MPQVHVCRPPAGRCLLPWYSSTARDLIFFFSLLSFTFFQFFSTPLSLFIITFRQPALRVYVIPY